MEEFKSQREQIKQALDMLIIRLEKEDKYSSVTLFLRDFGEEFQKKIPDKNILLFYLDRIFQNLMTQFPNESYKNEEDKKAIDVINKFNTICQGYISNLKDEK